MIDAPADADGFGVHGRIANAIVEVVREQPHIKMIGLLGDWGSGKSTVVKLVKKALQDTDPEKEVRCFVYDTWLRQSEPPRRAFLEGLVTFLANPMAVDPTREARWQNELAELKGQLETVDTESGVHLTGPGKVMVLLIAALPIGLKLIGGGTLPQDAFETFRIWPLERFWPPTLFVLGWVLTLLPFSAVAWFCLVQKKTLSEVASLFANKPRELRRETRSRRPEPTAIEFQAMFHKILAEEVVDPRHLLIVIDNLDRLPPAEAVTLWATMRGFFLDAREGEDQTGLPTVLVPIDSMAAGRIHGEPANASKATELSQAFVDKTFDLVFQVPPPVLSSWQRHLETRLAEVLRDELEGNASLDVRVIYEAFLRQKGTEAKITPRDLNSFVNSVAVLWMQHRGEGIALATMAYFICDRLRLTRDLHATLSHTVVDLKPYDADWRRGLAALCFGVDKARADELYMKDPIRKAIEEADAARIQALAEEPSFDIYLDQVLDEPLVSTLAAVRVFSAAALKAVWVDRIWRRLCAAAPKYLELHPFTSGDDAALACLFQFVPPEEQAAFLAAVSVPIATADPSRLLEQHGRYTAAVAHQLVELAEQAGVSNFAVALPGHARVFAHVIGHELSPKVRRALSAKQSRDVSVSDAEAMARGELEPAILGLRALAWLAEERWDSQAWSGAVDAVAMSLKSSDPQQSSAAALATLAMQRWLPQAETPIKNFHLGGALLSGLQHLLEAPTEAGEIDSGAAALIALTFKLGGSPQPPRKRTWRDILEQHPALGAHLDLTLRDLFADDTMVAMERLLSNHQAHADLVRAAATARYRRMAFEEVSEATLLNLAAYFELLEGVDDLWRGLATRDVFWEALREVELHTSTRIFKRLVVVLDESSLLERQIQSLLDGLDRQMWVNVLRTGCDPMPLIEALEALPQNQIVVGSALSDALANALPRPDAETDAGQRRRWFTLARMTSLSVRKALLDEVGTAMLVGTERDPLEMLVAGGSLLAGPEGLGALQLAGGVLIPKLLSHDEGIDWLVENAVLVAPWISRTAEDQQTIWSELGTISIRRPDAAEALVQSWFADRAEAP